MTNNKERQENMTEENAPEDSVEISMTPEEELDHVREQLAAETERRLRILAESENLKKRLAKEKEEFVKFAVENLVGELLPVLDHLELALAHGRKIEACSDLVMGVDMTRKSFVDILGRHGVEEFGAEGEAFNPEFHEAVGVEESGDIPEDAVVRVMQKGVRLRERLLRPAKVIVNKKGK